MITKDEKIAIKVLGVLASIIEPPLALLVNLLRRWNKRKQG